MVQFLARMGCVAGDAAVLAYDALGITVDGADVAGWQHPWRTKAAWDAVSSVWRAGVEPGFVNGLDPDFAAVRLLDGPTPELRGWRKIGGSLGGDEAVHPYFLARGVQPLRPLLGVTSGGELINRLSETRTPAARELRAMDVVLAVARPALRGTVEIVDATGITGVVAQYRTTVDVTAVRQAGGRPKLRMESRYAPPQPPSLAARLLGLWTDPTEDTRLIATVYLLSPQGTPEGAEPDGTWQAITRHHTWWNLCHGSKNTVPVQPPPPIRLFTGLAAGLGDAIGNQILSGINEFSDRVSNAINNVTMEGQYYT